MAFNPIEAQKYAKTGMSTIDKGMDTINKGADIYNKVADGISRRRETRKDGVVDRTIRAKRAATEDFCSKVGVAINCANTISGIYEVIVGSIHDSKELKNQIENDRRNFELDKQKLNNDLIKFQSEILEEAKDNADARAKKHEKEMKKMQQDHEALMVVISNIIERANKLLDFTIQMASKDPTNPNILECISLLNGTNRDLNDVLRTNNTIDYIEG